MNNIFNNILNKKWTFPVFITVFITAMAVILPIKSFAANLPLAWTASFAVSGASQDQPMAITVDSSGNVYVAGFSVTGSSDYPTYRGFIIKYNSSGAQMWEHPVTGASYLEAITTDSSGNVYATGNAFNTFTIKYDSAGNLLWQNTYNPSGCGGYGCGGTGSSIITDSSGNVYVTGIGGPTGIFEIKYDNSGNTISSWDNVPLDFWGPYGQTETLDSSGNIYEEGSVQVNISADTSQPFVIKRNNSGNLVWDNTLATGYNSLSGIAIDSSGNVYVAVDNATLPNPQRGGFLAGNVSIIKYNSSGGIAWQTTYDNGLGGLGAGDVGIDSSGNVFFFGTNGATLQHSSLNNFFMVGYSGSTPSVWNINPGINPNYAIVDSSDNVYITGTSGAGAKTMKYAQPTTTVIPSSTPAAIGTINVTSENSVTGDPVSAMWFTSASDSSIPSMNVCEYEGVAVGNDELCSGTSGVYANIPTDNDIVGVSPSSTSAGTLYALGGVKEYSSLAVKKNDNILGNFIAFSKDLLVSVANAQRVCSYTGTPGQPCPSTDPNNLTPSQTLTNPGDNANFTILWNPVAVMSVAPSAVSLDTVNNTVATTTVSNTGAPGSTLDWNAATTYDVNGSGWLSINNGSDQASGSLSGGASSTVNFTANTTELTAGTYQATVKFSNASNTYNYAYLTVTLTVSTSTPPGCPDAPGCEVPTISVTASPSTITLGSSTQVMIASTNATSCTESGDWSGTSCGTTITETPTSTGTFTYNAAATNANGSAKNSATVTVITGGGGCTGSNCPCTGSACGGGVPTISVTANPSSITLGNSTQVTITSVGATSCTESGSWLGTSCGTTITETPTSVGTFIYSASATNANGNAKDSATVTVTSPGGPSCNTFTATPSSIVPGSKSKLTYICTDVTSCIISSYVNEQFTGESSGGATGSESVGPSATTVYKLSCDAVNPQSVQVTVTNPGLNETNP